MVSNQNPRVGHRLLLSMGLRKAGHNEKFDRSYEKYSELKAFVDNLEKYLERYANQVSKAITGAMNASAFALGSYT